MAAWRIFVANVVFLCLLSCSHSLIPKDGLNLLYYSPSIIGQDPHEDRIDIYTDFFDPLHERDLSIVKRLGATHVIVSSTWAPDNARVHDLFLNRLKENGLKLIVEFNLPTGGGGSEDDDKADLDNAKSDWVNLLKEFERKQYADLIWGYYIPVPPIDKISSDQLRVYYSTISHLQSKLKYSVTLTSPFLLAGFPVDPRTGDPVKYKYESVKVDAWVVDIFGGDTDLRFSTQPYYSYFEDLEETPPLFPSFKIDSFSMTEGKPDEEEQDIRFESVWKAVDNLPDIVNGTIVFEFSDEWWRGDLSVTGIDNDGCPNSNAYAHSSCGVLGSDGDVVSLEFLGLYSLRSQPFSYCLVPKPMATRLKRLWNDDEDLEPEVSLHCAGILYLFPTMNYLTIPVILGIVLVVVSSIYVLPPPRKRTKSLREHEMRGADEFGQVEEEPEYYNT